MSELHCDDVDRLRSALSWMGYATPEGLETCCLRQTELVRDLIRAVLDQKKRRLECEHVDCACGDRYPNYSYGAGFIDAAGHCPNCHASLPAAEDAQGWLSYIDPECIEAQENALHTVSGFRAGQAFNELCRMLGGSWPDAKMQEQAPTAHKFFMELFGCGQLAGTSFPNDWDDANRLNYLIDYCCSDDWAEIGRIQSAEVARKRIDEWMARDEWYQRTAAPAMSQDSKGEGK